jgi:UDP-N-acetylmuramoyl-L-alanyl-D-glutamate--2,6-diaminopimelate ligase
VKDARLAASYIFSNWNQNPEKSMKMVGITGTNGKTSTTYMLSRIFEEAGYQTGIIGTIKNSYGNHEVEAGMTTPDPEHLYALLAEMRDHGVQIVFMEVSSHSLALGRVAPIHFQAAAYTNLTPEHLDFHKTMQEYALAKEILFSKSDIGVFNIDNSFVKQAYEKNLCKSYSISAEQDADFRADHVNLQSMNGVSYELKQKNGKTLSIESRIPGGFTVYNTLGAITLALLLGVDEQIVVRSIKDLEGVPGRIECVTSADLPFSVVIDYAHTPDALENIINSLLKTRSENQKLTVLFGCGGDRDKTKRPVMGQIATDKADFTIVTSDNSRTEDPNSIIEDILKGISPDKSYIVIPDRRQAIEYAVLHAQDGEIILIAGKGHENYEIKKDGKHPFSEKEEVAKAIRKRYQK